MSSTLRAAAELEAAEDPRIYPVGSVVVLSPDASGDDVLSVVGVSRSQPWLPVLLPAVGLARSELRLARLLLPRCIVFHGDQRAFDVGAISSRHVGPTHLLAYLSERCLDADSARLLSAALFPSPWKLTGNGRTSYYQRVGEVSGAAFGQWRLAATIARFAGHAACLAKAPHSFPYCLAGFRLL